MSTDLATPRVSFNARSTLRQTLSAPAHLQFNQVLYNQGDAFNSHTGDFTAPVAGTYVFVFHTESMLPSGTAHSNVKANNVDICIVYISDSDGSEQGSCPAIVHLNSGDRVWVEPFTDGTSYQYYTASFIGFLLSDDPQ